MGEIGWQGDALEVPSRTWEHDKLLEWSFLDEGGQKCTQGKARKTIRNLRIFVCKEMDLVP